MSKGHAKRAERARHMSFYALATEYVPEARRSRRRKWEREGLSDVGNGPQIRGRGFQRLEARARAPHNQPMTTVEIVGREAELEAVRGFVERITDGPRALVLTGEAGVGKTTLWRAGIAEANTRSFRVLTASPAAVETGMSFAALGDLLTDVIDEVLPALPPPQRRALEVALLLAEAGSSGPEQRAVAVAFLTALRALGAAGPVLVAVDDAQWLDAGSASVLGYAGRRLSAERVGLLLTERTGDAARPLLELRGPSGSDRVASIPVGPLTLGALHRLLHERLGLVVPRPILRRVHETAGGNPFYALEIARALHREDFAASGEPLPVPQSLSELVRDRVAALPARTQEALLLAAALSEPRLAVVAAALNGDAGALLGPAVEAQVISFDGDRIRFAHQLLASAAYGSADEHVRRDVHRRLAAALEEPEERARHLALAADGPDEAIATALEQAAEHARARGAIVAAAELYEQARRLTTADLHDELHRRTLTAARYRFAVGDMEAARLQFKQAVAAAPAGPDRAEALAGLAFLGAFEGDQPNAAELSRRALEEAGAAGLARASAARVLSTALMLMREDLEGALAYAEVALDCAERHGDEVLVANCLGGQGLIETLLGRPEARATCEAALALGAPPYEDRIVSAADWNLAVVLVWTDELAEAEALGRECYDRAVALGDEGSIPLVLAHRALGAYEMGRWREAAQLAEEGLEVALQTGQRPQHAFSLSTRALVRASLGLEAEARADAQDALALAGERAMAIARINVARAMGLLELSLARPEEAARLLAPHRQHLIAAGVGEPGSIRFVPDEIEALIGVGRLDEAETLLGWLEERGRALDRASALAAANRCRGLLLTVRQDGAAAFAAFEQALVEHERVSMPFERARTLLALGAAQRGAKRKRDARETLGQALATFERLDATIWAENARGELARIGGRAPSRGELTPTEERVAALVGEGRTNREVAAALVVSDRTVEGHLSHIYSKLGVRSRSELAHKLAAARTANE